MKTDLNESLQTEAKTIEVPIHDDGSPYIMDLNELFGAIDLHYKAQAEAHDLLVVDTIHSEGLLCLTPGEFSRHGHQTRVAIRASEQNGESVAILLQVRLVDHRAMPQVA